MSTNAARQSPFESIGITLKVALSPEAVANPIIFINQQLNTLLHRYHDTMKGVLLSYSSDLKFETGKEYARIIGEFPWLHVNVKVKCLIFKPEPGVVVTGKILRISESHIALLIYGIFNASISSDELKTQYSYNHLGKSWDPLNGTTSNHSQSLTESGDLSFKIDAFQEIRGVINIVGSLLQ